MSTAEQIVRTALYAAGAHSEVMPIAPEVLVQSVNVLASLLHELAGEEIDLGEITIPVAPATEVGEPDAATQSLSWILAARLAPLVQLPVSPDTRANATRAKALLKRRYLATEVPAIVPSRLAPRGRRWPKSGAYFGGQTVSQDHADDPSPTA